MRNWQSLLLLLSLFLTAYLMPWDSPRVEGAVAEAFKMLGEYAREHVLFCLLPALFIAGAIANFVSQGAVLRYFGAGADRRLAYSVASVSGIVLAVCSCTVLPLFAGIYGRGAGLGPAVAFLYSGPAVNVLAVILTARVLGWQLGVARAVGAVAFSLVIGLAMALLYRSEEARRTDSLSRPQAAGQDEPSGGRTVTLIAFLVGILVFAAWGRPEESAGLWRAVFNIKWYLVIGLLAALAWIVARRLSRDERASWVESSWGFARQILPLLFVGVLAAGLLLGRPGIDAGLIPSRYVAAAVGGNSLTANLAASLAGALMYFATLTEIPILQGLLGAGMGQGPALALLLAGPALSLPNVLVIGGVLGTRKTLTFVALVVVMATISGLIYGWVAG